MPPGRLSGRRPLRLMRFLRPTRTPLTLPWRSHVQGAPDAPGILRELLRDESVVCDLREAEEAVAWARAQPEWRKETPAVWVEAAW